jgi:hypothetical protein
MTGGSGDTLSADAARGLIASLFDLSFKSFVTPKVIQYLFILLLIALAIGVLAIIAGAFGIGAGTGILVLVLSPLIYILGTLCTRMYLELIIVVFRIYETLRDRPV